MEKLAELKFTHSLDNFREVHPKSETSITLENVKKTHTSTGQGIGLFKDSHGRLKKAKYKITVEVEVEEAFSFGLLAP